MTQNLKEPSVLASFSAEDLKKALAEKEKEEKAKQDAERKAYEKERGDLVDTLLKSAQHESQKLREFKQFTFHSLEAFFEKMKAYGDVKENSKGNVSIKSADGTKKVVYRKQMGYAFDERANMAEAKLKEFLETFVKVRDKKIYKLVVSLLERNKVSGDYDIKLINRLYAMEDDFDNPLWKESIKMFKEAYTQTATTTYVQFYEQNERGAWENITMDFAAIKF